MTEVELVAKEDLGIVINQILYVISDYDYSIIRAKVVSISKPYNEKHFYNKKHNYLVVNTEYLEDNTGGTVSFYPKHFNECIFVNEELAKKKATEFKNVNN